MARRRWVVMALASGALAMALGGCRLAMLGLGESAVSSGDGLGLRFDMSGRIVAVTADNRELPAGLARVLLPGGFYLREPGRDRDVEILGGIRKADDGMIFMASPAGLQLWAIFEDRGDCLEIRGRINNPSGSARGVTVGLCLPVDAAGWVFGRSILDSEPITGTGAYAEWTCADSDWDGRQINRGMFTPIYSEKLGLALGAVSDHPQIFRVGYRQGHGFSIEVDLGLSPLPIKFANTATFKFLFFRFDPKLHYRGALAKYYRLCPQDHVVRAAKFGNWLASATLDKIKAKAADYAVVVDSHGARYFKAAAEQGVDAFEYSRGHYDVVPIYAGTPDRPLASPDEIRRAVNFYWAAQAPFTQQTWKREPSPATQAEIGRNCCTAGPDGQMRVWNVEGPYRYEPRMFPNGYLAADIPTNPDPDLDSPNQAQRVLGYNFGVPLTEAREGDFKLAGHHIDGWTDFAGRYLENYRPSHLRTVDVPLTYSHRTGLPVQFHAFMWQELARPLAEYLHSQNMMLFCNDRPWRMSVMFDQPLIDVHGGSERPERNLDYMAFMRSLVGSKPISGTGIGQAGADPERTYAARELAQFERDLNALVPYCWFPGGFGPRALWRKYCLPMQEMAAAGWQPVTAAVVVHPDLLVERWGGPDAANVFYAVHNRGEEPAAYEMAIDLSACGIDPKAVAIVERFSGQSPEAVTIENSLVLRHTAGGRATNLFQLSRAGGQLPAGVENLTLPLSPNRSSVPPTPAFDASRSASPVYGATMDRLNMHPKTARRFLTAYRLEKRELAAAVAAHLAREAVKDEPQGNLDRAAAELANWLVGNFDSIYEAVLPAPTMTNWTAMRANYRNPNAWQLSARARLADGRYEVEVFDPLLEKAGK